ncbi:MAG: isoprenyl transferase [Prolixibacteraceae bacterium]|jgi:undecaprenyl diphosphate synthase|nr:isoprenyl transferase [Prolixibacteraceae bacterium]
MLVEKKLIKDKIPKHIAIIMDGNGRWAEKNGKERTFGHEHGVESVRSVVEGAGEVGVQYLTLYAFSTENWGRPQSEVDALMELLVHSISNETDELMQKNVRLQVIGDVKSLPKNVQDKLCWCIDKLKNNTGLTLVLALSYSSKWELTEAVRQIAEEVRSGRLDPGDIDKELIDSYLDTAGMPDPELLIRTSGENRISNFLLWQIAYSELYFTPVLWPDFRKQDLFKAIYDFQHRERRFGKTREQLMS